MSRRGSPALAVLALAVGLLAGGCSMLPAPFGSSVTGTLPRDVEQAFAAWRASGLATYTMDVEYQCFCALQGGVTVDVRDGQVASVMQEGAKVDPSRLAGFPLTIDAMYARIVAVLAQGGTVTADFDPGGIPTRIEMDPVPNAIDDELTIVIRQVTT